MSYQDKTKTTVGSNIPGANNPEITGIAAVPPKISRSQSANDATLGMYGYGGMYGGDMDPYKQQQYSSYNHPYASDPYAQYHDASQAAYYSRYHEHAASTAPDDSIAAYHQYHAQAAQQRHQQHQEQRYRQQQHQHQHHPPPVSHHQSNQLPPIYDQQFNAWYHSKSQLKQNQHQNNNPHSPHQNIDRSYGYPVNIIEAHTYKPPFKSPHPIYQPYQMPQESTKKDKNNNNNNKSDNKNDNKNEKKQSSVNDAKHDKNNEQQNENNNKLSSKPDTLKHAQTVDIPLNSNNTNVGNSNNILHEELKCIQKEKARKRLELDSKRRKLIEKSTFTQSAQRELDETKKKWNLEREEIIKSYGGKIPSFITESDRLKRELESMSNRNSALQASLEVISSHLQNELYLLQMQLRGEKEISTQTHGHNIELERRVRELRIEKLELENELNDEKQKEKMIESSSNHYDNNKLKKELTKKIIQKDDINNNNKNKKELREYPPESTVIQNLLQAQVEFYFSDYNLKRDKRLLGDVVKEPKKGYLPLSEVMKLSRIRQLCSESEQLEEALRRSTILTLEKGKKSEIVILLNKNNNKDDDSKSNEKDKSDKNDKNDMILYVGRADFEKPREKEFPFRRTVFIFGIPDSSSESFLYEMLAPFGTVSKIQFDHSPDGIDRKIGIKFLTKPRVYTLYYNLNKSSSSLDVNNKRNNNDDELLNESNNRESMIFKTEYNNNVKTIKCHKCGKDKAVNEGFYTTKSWKVIYCSQCAAQLAEDQLNIYYKERHLSQFNLNPRHKWLGSPPNDIQKRKTALVVFASQRQASKCAYVRTRIAYKGSFATHFHHYSKVKKEIVLNENAENNNNNKGDNNNNNNKNQQNDNNKNNKKNKNKMNNNNSQQQRYNQQQQQKYYQNRHHQQQQKQQQQRQQQHKQYNNNNNNMNMNNMNKKQPQMYRQSSAPTLQHKYNK